MSNLLLLSYSGSARTNDNSDQTKNETRATLKLIYLICHIAVYSVATITLTFQKLLKKSPALSGTFQLKLYLMVNERALKD